MSQEKQYGGIELSSVNYEEHGTRVLSNSPYHMSLHCLSVGQSLQIPELAAFSVFVIGMSDEAILELVGMGDKISLDDVIIVEGKSPQLIVTQGNVNLLLAGVETRTSCEDSVRHCRKNALYYVNKPWGHELWINGEHPDYAFKELFIKAGQRTSLQYHKMKKETILFYKGNVLVHYKNKDLSNDAVNIVDISSFPATDGCVLNLLPEVIHRVEAVSDIRYFEVSTPHFDDIIRIVDDNSRANGRINAEHGGEI